MKSAAETLGVEIESPRFLPEKKDDEAEVEATDAE